MCSQMLFSLLWPCTVTRCPSQHLQPFYKNWTSTQLHNRLLYTIYNIYMHLHYLCIRFKLNILKRSTLLNIKRVLLPSPALCCFFHERVLLWGSEKQENDVAHTLTKYAMYHLLKSKRLNNNSVFKWKQFTSFLDQKI